MKTANMTWCLFFVFVLTAQLGCEPERHVAVTPSQPGKPVVMCSSACFAPVKVGIMPLTELFNITENSMQLKVYIMLQDSFDSQIKAPGTFRFELYEYVSRSAESKGRRITIWPDIDLIDANRNNLYWRDFLRAYHFNLDLDNAIGERSILQITFLTPDGQRLSGEVTLSRLKK